MQLQYGQYQADTDNHQADTDNHHADNADKPTNVH